jgi:hypothetical protein
MLASHMLAGSALAGPAGASAAQARLPAAALVELLRRRRRRRRRVCALFAASSPSSSSSSSGSSSDAAAAAAPAALGTTTTAAAAARRRCLAPAEATSLPSALRGGPGAGAANPPPPPLLLLPAAARPSSSSSSSSYRRRVPPARATLLALLDGLEDADADALSFGPLGADSAAGPGTAAGRKGEDDAEERSNGGDGEDDDDRWLRQPTSRAAAHLARLHPQLLSDPAALLRWRLFLEAFDLPPRTRARLLAAAPELVTRGCVHSTGRLLLFYRAWGWSDASIRARIFAQWPRLLLSRVDEECAPVVEYARRALGATDDGVATLLWEYPRITRPRGVTVGGGTGGLGGWAGWAGGGASGDYRAQLRKFARLGMYGLRLTGGGGELGAAEVAAAAADGAPAARLEDEGEEDEEEEEEAGRGSIIVSSR